MRLREYYGSLNDPEQGISNVETACMRTLDQLHGMLTHLESTEQISSIYQYPALSTLMCLRDLLQSDGEVFRSNLRDAFKGVINSPLTLINYLVNWELAEDYPMAINLPWLVKAIEEHGNDEQQTAMLTHWNIAKIQQQITNKNRAWASTYVNVMPLIADGLRELVQHHGQRFIPAGSYPDEVFTFFLNATPIKADTYRMTPP